MKIEQVALQLYTLRHHLQTPSDIAATLKKVGGIGYQAVQASGLGPISEAELLSILNGEGLTLCATHEPSDTILKEPQAVVERLKKLNCTYTAYPYPSGINFADEARVRQLAEHLETAGKVLQEAGQMLTYHNHAIEFVRLGETTFLDFLYANTSPDYLQAEIDTYWVQYGGGDPVAWCEKLAGRLPLLHLKDYAFTTDNQPTYAEIGAGNLDWKKIIAAAEGSGCRWFIVEQDTCPGDPFDSVTKSYRYIAENLCA